MYKLSVYKIVPVAVFMLSLQASAQVLPQKSSVIKPGSNGVVNNAAAEKIIPQPKPFIAVNELTGSGTSTMAIRKINSNYELSSNDYAVIAMPAFQGGPMNITVTLPPATDAEGRIYVVKNAGNGFVHVVAQQLNEWGENMVRNSGTPAVRATDVLQSRSMSFQSDGKLWWAF